MSIDFKKFWILLIEKEQECIEGKRQDQFLATSGKGVLFMLFEENNL